MRYFILPIVSAIILLSTMIQKLPFPFYPTEAGGEFFAVLFVMQHTCATDAVPRTAFFCTGTIDALGRLGLHDRLPFSKPKVNWLLHMWTMGHGGLAI